MVSDAWCPQSGQVIVAFWTDAATDQSVSSDLPLEGIHSRRVRLTLER
jgi:hypothetical protein